MVHGHPSRIEALSDGGFFDHNSLRSRHYYTILSILQLGSHLLARTSLAIDHFLSLLWSLLNRLSISHVLSRKWRAVWLVSLNGYVCLCCYDFHLFIGSIQPIVRGRWFPWKNSQLCAHAHLWSGQHDVGGILCWCSFPGKCSDVYDGLCMGATEPRRQDEFPRFLYVQRPLRPVGHVGFLSVARKLCNDWLDWHCSGTHVLFLGIRVSSVGRSTWLADKTPYGAASVAALALWFLRERASPPCSYGLTKRISEITKLLLFEWFVWGPRGNKHRHCSWYNSDWK